MVVLSGFRAPGWLARFRCRCYYNKCLIRFRCRCYLSLPVHLMLLLGGDVQCG